MDASSLIHSDGLVPVLAIDRAEDACSVAEAFLAGDIHTAEITFRTDAAPEAIRSMVKNSLGICVGAGTVIDLDQCKLALDLGVEFIVSAGLNDEVVRYCIENRVPIFPGCVTPTEIMHAMELGLNIVKFFPANVFGGLNAIKALSAPFQSVSFMPTGGVGPANLAEYITYPSIYAVGGSWLCSKKDIAARNFTRITALCAEGRSIVRSVRGE